MARKPDKEYIQKLAPTGLARKLRRNQTDAEKVLWLELRNRRFANFRFRRQEVIENYIADFVCIAQKLIIEADGSHHDIDVDRHRTDFLRSKGFRVLRFSNHDILRNKDFVMENIWIALHDNEFDPGLTPPSSGASRHLLPTGRRELKQRRHDAALAQPGAAETLLAQFEAAWTSLGIHNGDTQTCVSPLLIAGYIAIHDEIDPAPIMAFLAARGAQLCLPVVATENAPLEFHAYQPGDALAEGRRIAKLPEPAARRAIVPNILLVPLLGFDRAGNRIGYGKGYYDRTLAALRAKRDQDKSCAENPNLLAIGLAYAEQETQITPAPHDQKMNIIVTPDEVIYCPAL